MTIPAPVTQAAIPIRAEDVHPLKEDDRAPSATLARPDGQPMTLSRAYAAKPTILIFYRGGWCPYCNTHLGQIAKAEAELIKIGYQVLAISPDQPEALRTSIDEGGYTYQLLSDSDMVLTRAFGLAFRVDDPTVEKYRGFGIDLDKASGRDHHLMPVSAVYIVDTQGVIRFAHWDADYKKRLESADLIVAARRIVGH
ncbi:MAG: alkyl hydroperoxide reductase [Phycisphaerae bacterium]|nr:MAG: alkyl hydroperoxide reductase [Phycisphaerae bacterium]